MVRRLIAAQFHKRMEAGRTFPLLCSCEDAAERHVGDYVVKLRGYAEGGTGSMLNELFASLLATHFDILVPEPAVVEISPSFAELVSWRHPEFADRVRNSVGLNFGCKLLKGGITWPVDKTIPEAMRQAAVNTFAFDALIQNPDRRFNNPNLLVNGDNVFLYDHESAFSFVFAIAPSKAPWELAGEAYLDAHVFFRGLKGKAVDLGAFSAGLKSLTEDLLDTIAADIPESWGGNALLAIKTHLVQLHEHSDDFLEALMRRLV
jgi:HipA-like protein